MRKSIFVKYFTVITSIILVCLTILGTLLISFSAQYWVNDKQEMLTRNAKSLAGIMGDLALNNSQIQWDVKEQQYSLYFSPYSIPESMNTAIGVMASTSNSDVRIMERRCCLPPTTAKSTRTTCSKRKFPPMWPKSP